MIKKTILPLCYAAPIAYYHYLVNDSCSIEIHSSYQKQTYASRCYIATANGVETLTVPIEKGVGKSTIKETKIANSNSWQTAHYRAIVSAYSSSAFFEYFEPYICKFYNKKYNYLIDFDIELQNQILQLLNYNDVSPSYTDSYEHVLAQDNDLREVFSAKKPFEGIEHIIGKPYYQLFEHKHGFIPNLSVFDLLFNIGTEARVYLNG